MYYNILCKASCIEAQVNYNFQKINNSIYIMTVSVALSYHLNVVCFSFMFQTQYLLETKLATAIK